MKKLRANYTYAMPATIQSRQLCLPLGYPKIKILKMYRAITFPIVLYGCET
jgi:hypothetical protein